MTPLEDSCQQWARSHCEPLWDAWLGHRPNLPFDVWLFAHHLDVWTEFARQF